MMDALCSCYNREAIAKNVLKTLSELAILEGKELGVSLIKHNSNGGFSFDLYVDGKIITSLLDLSIQEGRSGCDICREEGNLVQFMLRDCMENMKNLGIVSAEDVLKERILKKIHELGYPAIYQALVDDNDVEDFPYGIILFTNCGRFRIGNRFNYNKFCSVELPPEEDLQGDELEKILRGSISELIGRDEGECRFGE